MSPGANNGISGSHLPKMFNVACNELFSESLVCITDVANAYLKQWFGRLQLN